MAEVPDAGEVDGLDEADVWAQRLGWRLACWTVWGMAPLWVPLPVRWACLRRERGRGRRDG